VPAEDAAPAEDATEPPVVADTSEEVTGGD
jgi:hypothetical protein